VASVKKGAAIFIPTSPGGGSLGRVSAMAMVKMDEHGTI